METWRGEAGHKPAPDRQENPRARCYRKRGEGKAGETVRGQVLSCAQLGEEEKSKDLAGERPRGRNGPVIKHRWTTERANVKSKFLVAVSGFACPLVGF